MHLDAFTFFVSSPAAQARDAGGDPANHMGTRVEFIARIIGAAVLAFAFGLLGSELAGMLEFPPLWPMLGLGAVGAILGFLFTPLFTIRPINYARTQLSDMPLERLLALMIGIFFGLIAAALFSIPLSRLPSPFGEILPLAAALGFCYLGAVLMVSRYGDIKDVASNSWPFRGRAAQVEKEMAAVSEAAASAPAEQPVILLDTSVIIDGRVLDISRTGFILSELIVPNFILKELQHIADSSDSLRRNRGRRGLEILGLLQNESPVPISFTDQDIASIPDADSKLVGLARQMNCPIMTNDYNLNRVAELQGVIVLNINDLANAVKAAFLPGEELRVNIIQEGKEYGQGVGYLEDGTMVVVEDGYKLINSTHNVTVTKVLQTAAGRMIFAKP